MVMLYSNAEKASKYAIPADNRFGPYDVHNGKVPITVCWPQPPTTYSIDSFLTMSKRQEHIVLDTWRQESSWMNPSMIVDPYNRNKIIVVGRQPHTTHVDYVGYNWIHRKTWKELNSKDMIKMTNSQLEWRHYLVAEDARVFCYRKELYLVYNIHVNKFKTLYFNKLHYYKHHNLTALVHPSTLVIYQQEYHQKHEKNWTPFEYCIDCHGIDNCVSSGSSTLLFVYSIQPHRIVMLSPYHTTKIHQQHPNTNGDRTTSTMNANTVFITDIEYDDDWHWGEMRGGTPAIILDEDHYITFFHSRGTMTSTNVVTYVMGAYLFQR